MNELTRPDSLYLEAAQGWLELGNHLEANEELENIAPQMRAHPDVLQVRCKIYGDAGKWDYLAEIANSLCTMLPDSAFGPLHLAHALVRRSVSVAWWQRDIAAGVWLHSQEWHELEFDMGSWSTARVRWSNHAAANPAWRPGLQSARPVSRVVELGSFGLSTEAVDIASVAVGPVGGLPAVLSVV